jgi:hypothetical protein
MVEADSHLNLLPASILDIYNVFEHIDMHCPLVFGRSLPYLGQMIGFWVTLWSQNDVITSWLRVTATSNCFPHTS